MRTPPRIAIACGLFVVAYFLYFAYRSVFALAGFNPLPFRVACFAIMIGNLYLMYAVARRLTGSREAGALTTFGRGSC